MEGQKVLDQITDLDVRRVLSLKYICDSADKEGPGLEDIKTHVEKILGHTIGYDKLEYDLGKLGESGLVLKKRRFPGKESYLPTGDGRNALKFIDDILAKIFPQNY